MIAFDRSRVFSKLVLAGVGLGVGWWLFNDTYARHAGRSSDDGTIRFAHFGSYRDYRLFSHVIAAFERAHPGVRVKQEYVVGLAGQYNTKMRQQILSHTLPDLAMIQLAPFQELAGHFADLDGLLRNAADGGPPLAAKLDATALAAFRFKGRQRGLPFSGGNLQIYGNLECFERAGRFHGRTLPRPADDWTMEDFRHTAALLTCDFDGDGRIDQFGFWLPRWVYYLPFLWSFGAEVTDATLSEWRLSGGEAEQAIGFYRDLATDTRVCPRDDEVPQLFQDTGFLTGKVALCVNGPWFLPFLSETKLADSYFVAPIPRGPAGRVTRITWDGVVMARDLPPARRAPSREFIRFLLSKPVQDRIARTGRALPARTASLRAFVDPPGDVRRLRFVEALPYSRLQPLLPRFSAVDRVINDHLRRWIHPTNALSAHEMLDRLALDDVIESTFRSVEPSSP